MHRIPHTLYRHAQFTCQTRLHHPNWPNAWTTATAKPLSRVVWRPLRPVRRQMSSSKDLTSSSWIEHLPPRVQPYFNLARTDKPIGVLLLFYPCGSSLALLGKVLVKRGGCTSVVHHNGFLRDRSVIDYAIEIPWPFWYWCSHHERRRMHHK
jgi:hypothetical protein